MGGRFLFDPLPTPWGPFICGQGTAILVGETVASASFVCPHASLTMLKATTEQSGTT